MSLFRKDNPESDGSDESLPDEPIEGGGAVAAVSEVEAPDANAFSEEDLDALYDEEGNSFYVNDQGEGCDAEGNLIPSTRAEAAPAAASEPEASEPAAQKPRANYRSPMTTLLTAEEMQEAEELADPRVWAKFETMARRAAVQEVNAREQQKHAARSLGIRGEMQDEVGAKMSQVEHLVPAEMRGTKQGANTALLIAALQEAGEDGDVFSVMGRWGANQTSAQPTPRQDAYQAPPPKRTPPVMPPSARPTVPRSAPESVRSSRPAKEIGGLSPSELSVIQRERNAIKNGR